MVHWRRILQGHFFAFAETILIVQQPGGAAALRCSQAAERFLIYSYFYGFLILRSEQVAGTDSVARRQVADGRRAYGCVYIYVYICVNEYAYE